MIRRVSANLVFEIDMAPDGADPALGTRIGDLLRELDFLGIAAAVEITAAPVDHQILRSTAMDIAVRSGLDLKEDGMTFHVRTRAYPAAATTG